MFIAFAFHKEQALGVEPSCAPCFDPKNKVIYRTLLGITLRSRAATDRFVHYGAIIFHGPLGDPNHSRRRQRSLHADDFAATASRVGHRSVLPTSVQTKKTTSAS